MRRRKLAVGVPADSGQENKRTSSESEGPSTRALYLAAYDVAEPGRLAAALDLVRGYSTGGQKSVHEIYLTMPICCSRWPGSSTKLQIASCCCASIRERALVRSVGVFNPPTHPGGLIMATLLLDRAGLEVRTDGAALALYEQGERRGSIPIALLERCVIQGQGTRLDSGCC